jgi:outer membrane autotransporter protein
VIGQLSSLSPGQLTSALDQLAGDIYASISSMELQNTTTWMQLLSNRLAGQLRPEALESSAGTAGAPIADDVIDADVQLVSYQQPDGQTIVAPRLVYRKTKLPRWTGWTQGYGQGGSVSGNGNAGGLGYGLGGTLFGLDRWFTENTLVGMLGGYAGSSLGDHLVSSNAHINAYQVGMYAMHRRGRFYLSNIDALSFDHENVTRPINFGTIARTATGNSTGSQYAHYSEAGLTLGRGTTRFQPFSGLQYIYLNQRGYNETGAGSMNLAVANQNVNSVRGSVGCRIYQEYSWKTVQLIPVAQARYQREWADGTQLITSSFSGAPTASFVTAGNTLGRNFGLFGLGSNAVFSPRASFYGGYDLQVASGYLAHMGSASFQYRW